MTFEERKRCNRFLATIPSWIFTQLKALEGDPEGKIILRCPSCHGESRFVEIKYTDGKLTFETINGKPELGKPIEFEEVIICSEAALVEEHGKVK
jgi:hypothetical protein